MTKENTQIKIGLILNYINMGIGNLIPIFYMPIMLNLLGEHEYGIYKLAGSVTSYLSLISFGMGAAITRYIIKAYTQEGKDAEERVVGLFVIIFQIIATISFIVGVVISLNLSVWYGNSLSIEELHLLKILVLIFTINIAINFQATPYLSVVNAHEKFIFLQSMNIISTCIAPLLNLILLFMGFASIAMAVSSMVSGIIMRLLYVFYVSKVLRLKAKYKNLPRNLLSEIMAFSFWVFIATVVSQLYNNTDIVMIGAVTSLASSGVAVYNIGATLNTMICNLTTSLSSFLSPKINKMVFSGATLNELTDFAVKVGRLQLILFGFFISGFIVYGKAFINLSIGPGYKPAYWITVFMIIPNTIPLVQSTYLSVIVAQNKHKFRSLVYLGIAILNILGTWMLLRTKLGIIGAALMTGIATLFGTGIVMNWYYKYVIGFDIGYFWRKMTKLLIIPAIFCIFSIVINNYIDLDNILIFVCSVLIYSIIYISTLWYFALNDYEKNIFKNTFIKLKGFLFRK